MIVVVKVVGSGADGDPFRVPLPTYSMIAGPIAGVAAVNVPDGDFIAPDGTQIIPGVVQKLSAWLIARGVPQVVRDRIIAQYGDPDVCVAVGAADLIKWRQGLDKRYRERAGQYPVDVG